MFSVIFHPLLRMWLTLKGKSYVMMCFNRKSSYFTPVIELQPSKKSDIDYVSSTPPRSIFLIPIQEPEQENKVPSATHQAWQKLSSIARDQKIQPLRKHNLTSDKRIHSVEKCCFCSRRHKVGVDVPKCCEFGIAEDHLLEHFLDVLIYNKNSCLCSLSTLAEVLPKLASQNSNTGNNSSSNIEEKMWSPVVSPPDVPEDKIPVSRSKHATVLHGQCLYLLGGRNGNLPMKDFWKYCIADNKWYQLDTKGAKDFPGCLQEHTMIGYRDNLYIFGGEVGFSNGVETPLWIYNITKNEWKKFQAPKGVVTPKGRRSHTATVFQDSLYIYGGYQDLKGSTSELWAFHFASETWHLVSQGGLVDGPPPRHRHSAVLHNNALWVFGGMTDLQERSDFWRFDFVSRRWRPVKSKPGPGCLHSHCAVKFLSVMMLFGGEREGQTLNEMWRFHFATEFWEKLTFASTNTPMPRAQTTAFIFSQFTTRGAVHYMGLPEQDYFGSQPQPSGKKVKVNQSAEEKTRPSIFGNTSNNLNNSILPSTLKMSKYDIKGKQRCAIEEDIYEEIDDYKVEFKDPNKPEKCNKKSTFSFEPPDNCTIEDDDYENCSSDVYSDKEDESTNGKFNRLIAKDDQSTTNGDETYSAYDQIPKELLRDLKRSSNFRHLKEDSKRQQVNGAASQGNGKLLNGVQVKMSQLNLTRLSSISGTYSMFSNESTESLNTMGSIGTPTTIESNNTTTATSTATISKNGELSNNLMQHMKKSASSSFSISSSSGNTIGSPSVRPYNQLEEEFETEGKMKRDLRSVPNIAGCLSGSNSETSKINEQNQENCDSIELLNFADANEVQAQSSLNDGDPLSQAVISDTSMTVTSLVEDTQKLSDSTQINSTKQEQPVRSDSSYTFQSYDCSSRSSTLSSTAANNSIYNKNNLLSRPLKAINGKNAKSKASCPNTSGLLSKNGSQVKLIDLEDDEEEIEYPATYFNSTEDDLNDFSSLSGYESMEGGTHYEIAGSSSAANTASSINSNTKDTKSTFFSTRNSNFVGDSRKTIGCDSRLSFANPHYLCPDVENIMEKRGGPKPEKKIHNVFGERMLGIVRDELSHENFAQALNSPAESLISDYNDFQARLNHDLVELKGKNNAPLSAKSSTRNNTLQNNIDNASSHYYQTVEEYTQDDSRFNDPNHVELVQLRTKPSKTIHTPSMTPQLGRKMGGHSQNNKPTRPLSTGSILSSNSSFATATNAGMGTLRRRLPQQPIDEEKNDQFNSSGSNFNDKSIENGQPSNNRNQLKLLMYIVGGREIGQVTLFKRPISMWKLDLTKTF